jgi:uncharacterized protein YutE (UPF0331/DUF86 family)
VISSYTESILEHTEEHFAALLELTYILSQRDLTFHERNSAERSIQVVVEACIGLSKHICKKAEKQVLGEAAMTAQKALEILPDSPIPYSELRGAIGMRNAIVHNYLNLDRGLIEAVLRKKAYLNLKSFINASTRYLIK